MDQVLYDLGSGMFRAHVPIWNGQRTTFNPDAKRYGGRDLKRMAHQAGVDTAHKTTAAPTAAELMARAKS